MSPLLVTYLRPFNILSGTIIGKKDIKIINLKSWQALVKKTPWHSKVSQASPDGQKISWQSQKSQEYLSLENPENERVTEKIISDGKEMSKNMNDTEKEYGSVEQPLNIHWFGSNETTLVSEMTNITRKMLLLNQGIEKKQVQF